MASGVQREQSEEVASNSMFAVSNQLRFSVSSIDENIPVKIKDQHSRDQQVRLSNVSSNLKPN